MDRTGITMGCGTGFDGHIKVPLRWCGDRPPITSYANPA
jgi:hypothetical protein